MVWCGVADKERQQKVMVWGDGEKRKESVTARGRWGLLTIAVTHTLTHSHTHAILQRRGKQPLVGQRWLAGTPQKQQKAASQPANQPVSNTIPSHSTGHRLLPLVFCRTPPPPLLPHL